MLSASWHGHNSPQQRLALVVLSNAVSSGIHVTSSILYLTQVVGLSVSSIGVAFTISGVVGTGAVVFAGRAADRFGPTLVLVVNSVLAAAATLGFLAVQGWLTSVVAVSISTAGRAAAMTVTGPIINRIVSTRVSEYRSFIRMVFNAGVAIGAGASTVVAQAPSRNAFQALIIGSAAMLIVAAALVRGLSGPPSQLANEPSRWVVVRDSPYVVLTCLDGVLSLQFRIMSVIVPLLVSTSTYAPDWVVPALFLLNTFLVVLFQVRVGRTVDNPTRAGQAQRRAGVAFALATCVIGMTMDCPSWKSVVLLAVGVTVLSVGELWQSAAGFEIANTLAPAHWIGQYLGFFGVGLRMSDCIGPLVLTWLCFGVGAVGWLFVAALFVLTGVVSPTAVRWAESTRHRY